MSGPNCCAMYLKNIPGHTHVFDESIRGYRRVAKDCQYRKMGPAVFNMCHHTEML